MSTATLSEAILDAISDDLAAFETASPRSKQARAGLLGPSDIGFCRNKAALVTKGVQPTDPHNYRWAAQVGTAIGNYVEMVLKQRHPEWIVGSIDGQKVTATLPSGLTIGPGTPDIVIPELNCVLDAKSVDGFDEVEEEEDVKLNHLYQRWLYAKGLLEAGVLDDSRPVYVGNIYFDRSGREQEPLLHLEEWSMDLAQEIDDWVTDVVYAVQNDEDASRDVFPTICERICEFFTACRGNLTVHDGQDFTSDPDIVRGMRLSIEATRLAADAKSKRRTAKTILAGFNGTDGEYQCRWTEIQPTHVEGFDRKASWRMDVVKLKKGKAKSE